uniref:Putative non-ltr rnase hi domain of reverse transcriptases n=1 Tax=Ixodes ricinus TaxID=34613 RepID=A0A0K8R5I6_IXORI
MMQLTLEYIHHAYLSSRHIYTDGSTNFISSSIGAYIPSTGTTIKTKLSHITSSTAAELAAIWAAAAYISTQNPQNWRIFVDSVRSQCTYA